MRLAAGLILVLAGPAADATSSSSVTFEDGRRAFQLGRIDEAREIWMRLAELGHPKALFEVGVLHDLGMSVAQDHEKALGYYLEAAAAGLPEAQFNVAVMQDAGRGVPRDTEAAALWYGRAAAHGHARAQYNLGLLYERGDGVPENPHLAAVWYRTASRTLPAATQHLEELEPALAAGAGSAAEPPPALPAPSLYPANGIFDREDQVPLELVWRQAASGSPISFRLEVLRLDTEHNSTTVIERSLEESAALVRVAGSDGPYAWRVLAVDAAAANYATSAWQGFSLDRKGAHTRLEPTSGLPQTARLAVTIRHGDGDEAAARFAKTLARDLSSAGIEARSVATDEPIDKTAVAYVFAQDERSARDLSLMLPVIGGAARHIDTEARDAEPGSITISLRGGPAPG